MIWKSVIHHPKFRHVTLRCKCLPRPASPMAVANHSPRGSRFVHPHAYHGVRSASTGRGRTR